jgi:hypothetical protein
MKTPKERQKEYYDKIKQVDQLRARVSLLRHEVQELFQKLGIEQRKINHLLKCRNRPKRVKLDKALLNDDKKARQLLLKNNWRSHKRKMYTWLKTEEERLDALKRKADHEIQQHNDFLQEIEALLSFTDDMSEMSSGDDMSDDDSSV